jgi:hypothetical protein
MSADLIFYPESARDAILDVSRGLLPPEGWLERLENAGLVRTEEIEPTSPLGRPYVFIVHTKLNKRVYRVPELLEVRGSQVTIGVLKENSASGTLPRIEKQFIMILPRGSINEFDHIAARA